MERRNSGPVKDYQWIFFDLDGTLTDPQRGILNSIRYALGKLGMDEPDSDRLKKFIGPPLRDSFQRHFGLSSQTAWQAVEYYREYFSTQGMFENLVYPGIPELLAALRRDGKRLAVATSKPTAFSERILIHFELAPFFEQIVGSNLDGSRVEKREVIAELLTRIPADSRSRMLMIGDREHDIIGARANQIDSLGVAYGYGTPEELRESGPTYLANSVSGIKELLLKS
jgi:phosphoglycolate phosphatase